jgi:hypothetical protein
VPDDQVCVGGDQFASQRPLSLCHRIVLYIPVHRDNDQVGLGGGLGDGGGVGCPVAHGVVGVGGAA